MPADDRTAHEHQRPLRREALDPRPLRVILAAPPWKIAAPARRGEEEVA